MAGKLTTAWLNKTNNPLSGCAASPLKGDDILAAGRPLLDVSGPDSASFMECGGVSATDTTWSERKNDH